VNPHDKKAYLLTVIVIRKKIEGSPREVRLCPSQHPCLSGVDPDRRVVQNRLGKVRRTRTVRAPGCYVLRIFFYSFSYPYLTAIGDTSKNLAAQNQLSSKHYCNPALRNQEVLSCKPFRFCQKGMPPSTPIAKGPF
jgi:hypothetical protein